MLAVGIEGGGGELFSLPLEIRERMALLRLQQQWGLGFHCPASVGAENVPDKTQENWVVPLPLTSCVTLGKCFSLPESGPRGLL